MPSQGEFQGEIQHQRKMVSITVEKVHFHVHVRLDDSALAFLINCDVIQSGCETSWATKGSTGPIVVFTPCGRDKQTVFCTHRPRRCPPPVSSNAASCPPMPLLVTLPPLQLKSPMKRRVASGETFASTLSISVHHSSISCWARPAIGKACNAYACPTASKCFAAWHL